MNTHFNILFLFLTLAFIIGFVFFAVYVSSKVKEETGGIVNVNKKRLTFLLVLASLAILLLSVTLPKSPYFLYEKETPAKVVFVSAQQYNFNMSYQSIDPEKPTSDIIELPLHQMVEFRVTSFDVTHGFAIYNDNAKLIAQTQAMPGYVNMLRWKFDKPGTYNVLCLEFCGVAHAIMRTTFIVK